MLNNFFRNQTWTIYYMWFQEYNRSLTEWKVATDITNKIVLGSNVILCYFYYLID